MGRECRRVAPDWEPERNEYGHYIGLFDGARFAESAADWDLGKQKWDEGYRWNYGTLDWTPLAERPDLDGVTYEEWEGERPDPADYMPQWSPEEATHYRMFETVSEGSPVSPAFATPEELAQWCADNPDEVHSGGSYEQWLAVCNGAYAPSMILTPGAGIQTGVEALPVKTPQAALDLVFTDPDSDDDMTIRDYFKRLLTTLFKEGEGFSGKRPFGNSGWKGNLELPLVKGGFIAGEVETYQDFPDDYHEEVSGVDRAEYNAFVLKMVEAL